MHLPKVNAVSAQASFEKAKMIAENNNLIPDAIKQVLKIGFYNSNRS